MSCSCSNVYRTVRKILLSKEREFQVAYGAGPAEVLKLKLKILTELKAVKYDTCTCFVGEQLRQLQVLVDDFHRKQAAFKRDTVENQYTREVERRFDKVHKIMYTIGGISPE